MKRVGVLTSGGDAPGMNASIRAVVRRGIARGVEVVGIRRGYTGLIDGDVVSLATRSVADIIQRGGTVLGTSRSEAFLSPEGRRAAMAVVERHGLEALVLIGGDGTFRGGECLRSELAVKCIGVPGTIDNDLYGTDYSIGFDTAVNTALEAIDRIRDTAASHERLFFIEVMGRSSGHIALAVGVAGGAEEILVPEVPTDLARLSQTLVQQWQRGKRSSIVVVAEGEEAGGAFRIAERVRADTGMEFRVCVLGHLQRGGVPSARDRLLASRLGAAAIDALLDGVSGVMVGEECEELTHTPLAETWERRKPLDARSVALIRDLAG